MDEAGGTLTVLPSPADDPSLHLSASQHHTGDEDHSQPIVMPPPLPSPPESQADAGPHPQQQLDAPPSEMPYNVSPMPVAPFLRSSSMGSFRGAEYYMGEYNPAPGQHVCDDV
ncbi:hypothetical protein PAPYR_8585 [Paratrimastix pyriformis]|uniref:Uncharacterized protein n=1 Tax=Paratrimastix pyriformis TaxID=342808 RepID=A0ABQ8U094_9EUKA|nr:hypothetical protein PAPYR_13409 [Paratrimastix pyriformis]KAJ4456287.1 hypothetical protein PAPYR_8585 [Paratrimastix pyriformis]